MIIDTHSHLHTSPFQADRAEVVARARAAGIRIIALVGVDPADTERALNMAAEYPDTIRVVAGLHPHDADQWSPAVENAIRQFTENPQVIAVGEMGLDYYYKDKCDRSNERAAFKGQIRIALETSMPIVIHCRDAYDDLLAMLEDWLPPYPPESSNNFRGVLHCWAGSLEHARRAIALGFCLGIGGAVTFPRSEELRAQVAELGLSPLVLETDAPYITPVPFRGKRNESSYLVHVVDTIAKTLNTDLATVEASTSQNALKLYPRLQQTAL